VPKEVSAAEVEQRGGTDTPRTLLVRLKTWLTALPGAAHVKRVVYSVLPWEPFPEYQNPRSAEWQLMSAIIHRFKDLAGKRPVVVAPTFYSNYVRFRMARNYWDRYSALAATLGIHAVDLLPHFKRVGADAVRCFQDPHDMHFSVSGNLVLADALQDELTQRKLLPVSS